MYPVPLGVYNFSFSASWIALVLILSLQGGEQVT